MMDRIDGVFSLHTFLSTRNFLRRHEEVIIESEIVSPG